MGYASYHSPGKTKKPAAFCTESPPLMILQPSLFGKKQEPDDAESHHQALGDHRNGTSFRS